MSTPASQTPSFSRLDQNRPHSSPVRPIDRRSDGSSRFKGCAPYSSYEILSKLGEGTFGKVYKARSRKTGALLALKEILMHEEKEGFPITALREIKLLKRLHHPNVLLLEEMSLERRAGKNTQIKYMVTPYMDHDLSGLLENPSVHLNDPIIKCYMLQLLEGVRYLHAQQILHRDLKTANLLINNRGVLQIADFGLARPYFEEPPQPGKGNGEGRAGYTALVVTRWYRPPELLLGLKTYTPAIDLWGVGCILGEMYRKKPIMAGNSEINQAQLIFELVGAPNDTTMPGWQELPGVEGFKNFGNKGGNMTETFKAQGPLFLSLMSELLRLDWRRRTNAIDALKHPWFSTVPFPCKPGEIPRFEESHELDQRRFRDRERAALPPAPRGGGVGQGGDRRDQWMNGGQYDGPAGGPPRNYRGPPHGEPRRSWVPPDTRLPPRPPASRMPDRFDNHHNDRRPPRHDRDSYQPPSNADVYIPDYGEPLGATRNDRRDEPPRRPDRMDDRPRQQERPRDTGYDGARDRYDATRDRDRPREFDRDRDRDIDRYRTPAASGQHDNRERYVPPRRRSRSPRR